VLFENLERSSRLQPGGEPVNETARVVVVDDFEELLARLKKVLTRGGYEVTTFSSPTAFLQALPPAPPCCLLLDVEMPELSGLQVQERLLASGHAVPMVFMSGHHDLPAAIRALKSGAVDFLLKPFDDAALLSAVARAVAESAVHLASHELVAEARRRLDGLTPREHEVCLLVAEGLTSREIAERLGGAESTVSVHRARIMSKLQVGSIADLVRLVDLARRAPGA
jgi:FixJ family two-component response regulator